MSGDPCLVAVPSCMKKWSSLNPRITPAFFTFHSMLGKGRKPSSPPLPLNSSGFVLQAPLQSFWGNTFSLWLSPKDPLFSHPLKVIKISKVYS